MACKSIPKASPERLGSVPERPRRPPGVQGESPRATGDARKGNLERLGARRGDQTRRRVASESGKIKFSSCCAFAKHRRSNCLSFFVDSLLFLQSLRTLESAAPASKNKGSALHAPSRVARAIQPRKTTKINPKIDAKSSKITFRSGQCR